MASEKPIIFCTDMVKAILDGRKTQTRRIIKPQPNSIYSNGDWYCDRYNNGKWWNFWGKKDTDVANKCGLPQFKCPYGDVGDKLWVRETFAYRSEQKIAIPTANTILYRADANKIIFDVGQNYRLADYSIKWKSPYHMTKTIARLWLEVTDVKAERLQNISEEDAKAEGVRNIDFANSSQRAKASALNLYQIGFAHLWDSLNAKRGFGWETNPYVFVYTFKGLNND